MVLEFRQHGPDVRAELQVAPFADLALGGATAAGICADRRSTIRLLPWPLVAELTGPRQRVA
jgi:hypothetical protein